MSAKVTIKGQVTLPKAVREAAGIQPGDRVSVRAWPGGRVVVEKESAAGKGEAYRRRLEEIASRKPFCSFSTDELMSLTRGED